MSDMLSQEEIDALLKGGNNDQGTTEDNTPPIEDYFSDIEKDTLGEIGNISFGSSATALSTLLNQKVEITTPSVTIIHRNSIIDEFPKPYISVEVKYTEGIVGSNLLIINVKDAAIIADLMLGGNGHVMNTDLSEIHLSAVQEAMNQMMGSSATSMSTIFTKRVDISPPVISQMDLTVGEGIDSIPKEDILVKVSFRLKVGDLIDSNIMQLFPINFAKNLVERLLNPADEQKKEIEQITMQPVPNKVEQKIEMPAQMNGAQNYVDRNYESRAQQEQPRSNMAAQKEIPQVQPAMFASFDEQPRLTDVETRNLDMLYDIQLQVTVELGRTKRSVKDILELSQGSIMELDKLAGEPVDILINQNLVARGEVVVIDENFGVRVTDIVSKSERLNQLR